MVVMNGSVTTSAARTRDVCLAAPTGGGGFNTFVLNEVETLTPGESINVRGLYFTTGSSRLSPLSGSAVMGTDGQVRIGFFVHSTAEGGQNDFTVSGLLSGDYAGTVNFDNDGDFKPNGTLDMQRVNCSGIAIP
jgi:hypothetical protein